MKSPLSYMGGKFYIRKEIVSLLRYDVDLYIEPFFGSGQVFFYKKPHKIEIINDIDDDLINFYRVWINNEKELVDRLEQLPYSRSLYKEYVKDWEQGYKGKDDIERAIKYFYILRLSFSGCFGQSFSLAYLKNKSVQYQNSLSLIKLMHSRIKNAQVECKDYKYLLLSIPVDLKAMIYCDPPYYKTKFYYKESTFDESEHKKLAEILNSLENKYIILSYYYFDGIEDLYTRDKWFYLEFKKAKHSVGITKNSDDKKRNYGTELLLLNYDPNYIENKLFD
jgi:DNA adenine methylase